MTFDRIDRAFRRQPIAAPIRLECASCGTPDDVTMLYPLWRARLGDTAVQEPLCPGCSRRMVPCLPG
jgi:hypothetical protein